MKINTRIVSIGIMVVIFGGFALADFLGFDDLKLNRGGGRGNSQGRIDLTSESDQYNWDIESIRGSSTFIDIAKNFNIEMAVLEKAFNIEGIEIDNLRLSNLNEIYEEYLDEGTEFGTSSVKLFVAYYSGLDYETDEEIYLPEEAVEILLARGNLKASQIEYLKGHMFNIPK